MTQSEKKKADKKRRQKSVSKSKKTKSVDGTQNASQKKAASYKKDLENAKAFIADLENQLDLTKQKKEDIAEKTSELKKKLSAAQYFGNLISENISTAKDGFFILLYPSQGRFSCKIMRLYKKEKPKPIKGLDKTTIFNLISKYYPHLERQAAQTQPEVPGEAEPLPTYAVPATGKELQSLIGFEIVQAGISPPFNVIQHDEPFEVHLNVDLTGVMLEGIKKDAQLNYKILLNCKHLTGKPFQRIAEISGDTAAAKVFTEIVESEPLSPGTYRLEADATITGDKEKTKAPKSFKNHHMLHVD